MAPRSSATYAAVVRTGYALKGPFAFFRLPRELRDSIYDILLLGSELQIRSQLLGAPDTYVYLINGSRLRRFLVSRQFFNELQERISKISYLVVIQVPFFSGQHLMMPWKVNVSSVKLHLGFLLTSYSTEEDLKKQMRTHADEVINVICSRDLPFELDLYVAPAELVEHLRIMADNLDLLVSKEAGAFLTSLRVWLLTRVSEPGPHTSPVSRTLVASYSHLTGKLHCATTNEIYGGDNGGTAKMAE